MHRKHEYFEEENHIFGQKVRLLQESLAFRIVNDQYVQNKKVSGLYREYIDFIGSVN